MNGLFCQQHVGLAYPGRAWRAYRGTRRLVAKMASEVSAKENEPWRRISGITRAAEAGLTPKERRRGLRRLLRWIDRYVRARSVVPAVGASRPGEARLCERTDSEQPQDVGPRNLQKAEGRGRKTEVRQPERASVIVDEWVGEVHGWEKVRAAGVSVERVCVRLGVSRARLTALLKEACGLSAGAFVDGLRLRKLRGEIIRQMRAAARALWAEPGAFANVLAGGSLRFEGEEGGGDLRAWWKDKERRVGELLGRLDALRGADEEMALAGVAARLGFGSVGALKQTCVTVFGRTLRALERRIAREVVEFYLCAEERTMRELARMKEESGMRSRARWLYHGNDEVGPVAPFCDLWSMYQELKRGWLEKMWGEFG